MKYRYLAMGALAAILGLAVLAFRPAQGPGPGGMMGGWDGGMGFHGEMLPPQLQSLRNVPPDQRFSHFLGGTLNFTDANGTQVTVNVTPGTVTGVTATGVTVRPNGQTAEKTFGLTQNTTVRAYPDRGSLQALTAGDEVVVVTVGNSTDAVSILKHPRYRAATATPAPAATAPAATATPAATSTP